MDTSPKPPLIGKLFEGPIDIVGDIHGEIDALHDLLKQIDDSFGECISRNEIGV